MRHTTLFICLFFSIYASSQLRAGDSLKALGSYGQALEAYGKLPDDEVKYFKVARVYAAMGNTKLALTAYQDGLRIDKKAVLPRFEFAKLLLKSARKEEAFYHMDKLVQKQPDNPAFHYYLGRSLQETDDSEMGRFMQGASDVSAFAKALSINPDYRLARTALVTAYIKKREFKKAMSTAGEGLQRAPEDIKMNSLFAQAAVLQRDFQSALPVFEKLFELGSDTEYNRLHLGRSYQETGKIEKAIESHLIYLEDYRETDPVVWFLLSQAYLRNNELDNAQDAIERSIVFKTPRFHQEYMQLATVYAEKNDLKNAFYAIKKASKEAPGDENIAYQLAVAADRYFKDDQKKLDQYRAFIERFPEGKYTAVAQERAGDLKRKIFMSDDN